MIDAAEREFVRRRAGNRGEYCLLDQEHSGLTHHIENIVARGAINGLITSVPKQSA